jgi:hypothetical protein
VYLAEVDLFLYPFVGERAVWLRDSHYIIAIVSESQCVSVMPLFATTPLFVGIKKTYPFIAHLPPSF